MRIHAIHPLIDVRFDAGDQKVVFHGTHVPISGLYALLGEYDVFQAINEFVSNNPAVTQVAASALLALSGRYDYVMAFEQFLSYSPQHLAVNAWGEYVPKSMAEFNVDWSNLIVSSEKVPINHFEYTEEICQYLNVGAAGVFIHKFEYSSFEAFDRLVEHQINYRVFNDFVSTLISGTDMRDSLTGYSEQAEQLAQLVSAARFSRLSPFYIEAKLSDFLFHSGTIKRFYHKKSVLKAQSITQDFINGLLDEKPEGQFCLVTHMPWGGWFDVHSCHDFSILAINRHLNIIWLITLTDSD